MEVLVPKTFESDSGLITVARRLAMDNAKFPTGERCLFRIYSDDSSHLELAEYFHFEAFTTCESMDQNRLVSKIIKLPKEKPSSDASISSSDVSYKVAEGW